MAVGCVPAARIASPCSAATMARVCRRWRICVRASAMSTCGEDTTSICDCRNSPTTRPPVAARAASKKACGISLVTSLVWASTKKYSSSMPTVNRPCMDRAPLPDTIWLSSRGCGRASSSVQTIEDIDQIPLIPEWSRRKETPAAGFGCGGQTVAGKMTVNRRKIHASCVIRPPLSVNATSGPARSWRSEWCG